MKLEIRFNWLSCGSCNISDLPEIDYTTSKLFYDSIYGGKKARYWNNCKDKMEGSSVTEHCIVLFCSVTEHCNTGFMVWWQLQKIIKN